MKTIEHKKLITVFAITGFVAAFFTLLVVVFHREEIKRIYSESQDLLDAITESKQVLLSNWIYGEIVDVSQIIKNPNLTELTNRFVEGRVDASALIAVFNQIKLEHDFADLVLLSETGDYLTSTNRALTFNDSIDKKMLFRAFATDSSYTSDLYRSSIDHRVYIDLVSILRNSYGKAIGGIIFKINAEETLDKMLSDWQMVNYRAIVSLIKQQPDKKWIVYKPDSSHVSDTSCWQHLPLRFRNDPFNPRNRLLRVISMPNTPWSLMVEMDNSTRKADTSTSITLLSIISVVSVLVFFFALLYIANNQENMYSEKLTKKEFDLDRMKNQFWFTMDLLGEAIVMTDAKGLIQYMNLAAELVSGWKLEEVEGKPLEKQIPLLQEESGMSLFNVRDWFSSEDLYTQHIDAYLVNKSGAHIRVLCSLAPLKAESPDNKGLVVVLVINNGKQHFAPNLSDTN